MRTGRQNEIRQLIGRTLLALIFLATFFHAMAAEVMPPKPVRYFNDYANVVPANTAEQLNQTLEIFERETSSQIVVAVFPKMQSDSSIEDYTQRVAQNWGVGQKDKNNGAVLFVFIADRKMFIQVGYGLEGVLPDALAKRIVEDEIKPHFKNGDYAGGLTSGVAAILQAVKGEYKGTGRTAGDRNSHGPGGGMIFFFTILVFFMISQMFRRRGTVYSRRGRGIYPIIWGGGGGGGGWSGGGGGGGGFSGGGGSFGGGGAGGSW